MPLGDRREEVLAITCGLLRFAVCCYRAAHQAIIVDEATTYNKFVSGPWRKLFGRYDANNHILSSILIKATVTFGGLSEFKLRLPSLIGGFFLTLGVFWLLKRVASPALRWTAFALVCLHPLLLDFSIAARGYSISLAFFVWALYFCQQRRYLPAGILLGLSIGANLAILFPVLALFVVVTLFEFRPKPLLNLIVPALALATLVNYASLRRAQREDFYIGYPEFHSALTSFVFTSLHARPDRDGILGGIPAAKRIGDFGLPLFLAFTIGAAFFTKDRRQLLPLLTLAITIAGLILARWLFAVNYPADRTCLYFVILGAVAWAVAGDAFKYKVPWMVPMVLLLVQFSTQLQMGYFQFWRSEKDNKVIASLIQQASTGEPEASLTLSTTWLNQPSLEFYRRYLHITALRPVERFESTPLSGFDFYVLSLGDFERGKDAHLRKVFIDPDVEVMLAEP